MLKVACESCGAPYQIDEKRVPKTGLKMRCPKCGHAFVVAHPGADAAATPSPAAKGPGKPPVPHSHFGGVDLPAPAGGGIDLPAPTVRALGVPDAPPSSAGLPAAKRVSPAAGTPRGGLSDLPAPRAGIPDLPARPQIKRAAPPPQTGLSDLPARNEISLDLPSPTSPKNDLPAVSRPASSSRGSDLPAVFGGPSRPPSGAAPAAKSPFSDGIELPELAAPGLPVVSAHDANEGRAGLPSPAPLKAHLPATVSDARMLPSARNADFGAIELDAPPPRAPKMAGFVAEEPTMARKREVPEFEMPPLDLPPVSSAGFGEGLFGELELPVSDTKAESDGLELELPSGPPPAPGDGLREGSPFSEPPLSAGSAANFGEIELSGGGGGFAPPSGGGGGIDLKGPAPAEVSLPTAGSRTPVRKIDEKPKSQGKSIAVLAFTLVLFGGAALQLTKYGAFGYLVILDAVHAKDYAASAKGAEEATEARWKDDTFQSARAAADDVAFTHESKPRALALTAYATYVERMHQLRFGADAARANRADGWAVTLKQEKGPYVYLGRSAGAALAGDYATARAEAASARTVASGTSLLAAALLQGEIELRARDGKAAAAFFDEASKSGGGARAHFGKARAALLDGDFGQAKISADATIKESPQHPGAALVLATAHLEEGNYDKVLTATDRVLKGPGKEAAGPKDEAEAHALRGWALLRNGKGGEAKVAFEASVKQEPTNVLALTGLGESLYSEARYGESLVRFEAAVAIDPNDIGAVVGVAKAKIQLNRTKEAKEQLAALRAAQPTSSKAALWNGRLLSSLGDYDVAEKEFDAAVKLAPVTRIEAIDAYVGYAAWLAERGKAKEAEAKLAEAKAKLPTSPRLDRAFGEISVAQGKFEEGIAHYQAALARNANDSATRFLLGAAYRKMGNAAAATAELDKVYATDKDYPGLALERGLLFEMSGNVQKALDEFKGALAKAPNDADLQLRVAAAYVTIGKADDAIPMLEKVMRDRPQSAETYHYMGRAHLLKGGTSVAESMRFLRRAVELDPNRAEYHVYVAWAASELVPKNLALAEESSEKALAIDKLNGDAYWQRAVWELAKGLLDDALRDVQRAIELRPSRAEAHATLAEIYDARNQPAQAAVEWHKAVQANDKQPYWRYRIGKMLFLQHKMAEAAPHLEFAASEGEKMTQRPGWLVEAEFQSAETLKRAGKKAEAIPRYQAFLRMAPENHPDRDDARAALKALGAPERE